MTPIAPTQIASATDSADGTPLHMSLLSADPRPSDAPTGRTTTSSRGRSAHSVTEPDRVRRREPDTRLLLCARASASIIEGARPRRTSCGSATGPSSDTRFHNPAGIATFRPSTPFARRASVWAGDGADRPRRRVSALAPYRSRQLAPAGAQARTEMSLARRDLGVRRGCGGGVLTAC